MKAANDPAVAARGQVRLEPLTCEWLLDLQVWGLRGWERTCERLRRSQCFPRPRYLT